MFDRTLPRLVALALGVLVLLKLMFPEPPFETTKKEEEEKTEPKKPRGEAKPAASAGESDADTSVRQVEVETVAARESEAEEKPERETPADHAASERPGPDAEATVASKEEPVEEAPPTSPPIEPAEAPPPEPADTPSPIEPESGPPLTGEEREAEARPPQAAAAPPRPPMREKDIVDAAVASGSFAALRMALEQTRLAVLLRGPGPFTVFAPTDKAFAELETLDQLMADTERLSWVLKNHIVRGHYGAADLAAVATLDAISGARLAIDTSDDIKVENASVVEPDILALNGVIHAINRVLIRKR